MFYSLCIVRKLQKIKILLAFFGKILRKKCFDTHITKCFGTAKVYRR